LIVSRLITPVRLSSLFGSREETALSTRSLLIGTKELPVVLVRHPRARRYLLRLRADGTARVTIPRRGSLAEAQKFLERSRPWLERQIQRLSVQPARPSVCQIGSEILFRGETVRLEAGVEPGTIRFGSEIVAVPDGATNFRPAVEKYLRQLAAQELPPLVFQFAAQHALSVSRVTVRAQKTRWGSCSRRRAISLNWRLIQTPLFVRDYIILHELMHLREMNHSARFWREVQHVCPEFQIAERWLKQHPGLLH
jgi:predicted metal-dependent hydrolase